MLNCTNKFIFPINYFKLDFWQMANGDKRLHGFDLLLDSLYCGKWRKTLESHPDHDYTGQSK